jgi:hypothetical protein
MKKKLSSPPQRGFISLLAFLFLLINSCKKNLPEKEIVQEEFPTGGPGGGGTTGQCRDPLENESNYDSIAYQTILGNQLIGSPYSVTVMRQASQNLYGHSSGISVNKKYIRFRAADEDQITQLLDLNLELFDYPLTYDVIAEGDYYVHPGVGPDEEPWLYTVVEPSFQPPAGITYEWLADLHVPDQDIWLEEEALRITGNPTSDTCNLAEYRIPPCPYPLDPDCGGGGGGGGGTPPVSTKIPSGKIEVWDSNKDQNVPVRRVRVVARRWFKIETVYTNDQGSFQCSKRFRNKVNVFVKFLNTHLRTSGLFANSGLVGGRIQRALWPIKRGIGAFSGDLTRINHVFVRGDNQARRLHRHWWAAQLMNAYLEFNTMAAGQNIGALPTQKMRIILTRLGLISGGGATPMNSHRVLSGLPSGEYFEYFFAEPASSVGAFYYNALLNGRLFRWIDMGLGYRTFNLWESNRVKDLMYHELAHAAHFNKVRDPWWNDLVFAESFTIAANLFGPNNPYGAGADGPHSEIISVGESWAEHVAQVFCDIQYSPVASAKIKQGNLYLNNFPVAGLSSHLNAIEDFSPNRTIDPFRWIPEGIYYDLIDNRNDNNFNVILPIDNAASYTNLQFFNALDTDVKSMPQFRTRFLAENGFNQAVINLFTEYHY